MEGCRAVERSVGGATQQAVDHALARHAYQDGQTEQLERVQMRYQLIILVEGLRKTEAGVDDDVFQFKKLYNEKGEKCNIKDPNEVQRIVEELHELAEMLDVHCWGYTNRKTPVQYDEQCYLSFTRQITGCSYGVRFNENVWWNEELKLKEDFWISCYMKFKERRILTDERYTFVQKDTFVNAGGLSEIRNHDEERRSILFMRKMFGEAIQLKGQGSNGSEKTINKVQYNIITNFRF